MPIGIQVDSGRFRMFGFLGSMFRKDKKPKTVRTSQAGRRSQEEANKAAERYAAAAMKADNVGHLAHGIQIDNNPMSMNYGKNISPFK